MRSTICVAEDRKACEPCLKLLLLSLNHWCPEWRIDLFYPPADEGFRAWLRRVPRVHLEVKGLQGGCGWNIKPHAIMHLLDAGFEEVIWIDSDILITENVLDFVSRLEANTFVATDHTASAERDDTNARRAQLWGLQVGRVLPSALSSGVVRATHAHYGLMQDWWNLLQSQTYLEFQKRKWTERPIHMLGDQDVLTALLTSSKYAAVPLYVLRRGKHILQFDGIWGYTVAERVGNLLGLGPAFIHAGAGKPWSDRWPEKLESLRDWVKWVYLDVSPYTLWAMQYKTAMECDTVWMSPHFFPSRLLRIAGLGRPSLSGLPMAVIADIARMAKWVRGLGQSRSALVQAGAPHSVPEK